jgi:hypothetical protein
VVELFVPSRAGGGASQRRLLTHAAQRYEYTDPDAACELYLLAAHFGRALLLLNMQLGKQVAALGRAGPVDTERVMRETEATKLRANAVKDRCALLSSETREGRVGPFLPAVSVAH